MDMINKKIREGLAGIGIGEFFQYLFETNMGQFKNNGIDLG
jgi:hypothetical protein